MKTKIRVLTTLAFFIVSIGFATNSPRMNIIPVQSRKALLAFESPFAAPLEITITDSEGLILYYQKTDKELKEYRKVFDFSNLGKGNFNICLSYGVYSINRDLFVSRKKTIVGPAEKLYEPYFFLKDGNLNLSFFNVAQKNVHLEVIKNGESISITNLGKDMSIQKSLNLIKSREGNYEVVLTYLFKKHRFFVQL